MRRRVQPRKRLLAAIDVGTNTVRMLIAAQERGRLRPVVRRRWITGLGKNLRATGGIGEREFRDSLEVLRKFRKEMDALGVARVRACGTAGLREASNRDAFLSAATEAGVSVEIISAREEARCTWEGSAGRLRDKGATVVMDIGGGSTEFIAGPGERDSVSLPIGVVVLPGFFRLSDPPRPMEMRNMEYFVSDRISAGTRGWRRRKFRRMVGTAGTFTTLAALELRMKNYRPERIDGYRMPISAVRRWEKRLVRLTEKERLKLHGMEKGRERYIVPGVVQALAAMEHFGLNDLLISDSGLLEGILRGIADGKGEWG
jgi:exopolyphosphatase/guanosine-5'-triphosphate,3'-diphosphate pyrophosphatase